MDNFSDLGIFNQVQYKELLTFSGQKVELQLGKDAGNSRNWFYFLQLSNLFKKDRENFGFWSELTDLEKCLIEPTVKQISKIYKILLQWFTEDEYIKEYMTKCALDFKADIDWDSWEFLWKKIYANFSLYCNKRKLFQNSNQVVHHTKEIGKDV